MTQELKQLERGFLDEVLGSFAGLQIYVDAEHAMEQYFETLKPYNQQADFQVDGDMPRPSPLQILVADFVLYGFFRAWLRKHRLDPDRIEQIAY